MEILGQLAIWKSAGYRVSALEKAARGDILELRREYDRVRRAVGRIQQIESGLRELENAGVETDTVRHRLRDVEALGDVEQGFEDLRREFEGRIPAMGQRLSAGAVPPPIMAPPAAPTPSAPSPAGATRVTNLVGVTEEFLRATEPVLPLEVARDVERTLWRSHPPLIQVMIRGDRTLVARLPENERSASALGALLEAFVAKLRDTLGEEATHRILRERLAGRVQALLQHEVQAPGGGVLPRELRALLQ